MYIIGMDHFQASMEFIENTKDATSLRQLAELFWSAIKKMGCKYFVCASSVDPLNPPDHAIVLTNYPMEWAVRHSEKQYFKIDPVFKSSLKLITPFSWSSETWRAMLNFDQTHILDEATEVGLTDGFTVPLHSSSGYPASVSVVFNPGEVAPEAIYAIQLMSPWLYETALRMKVSYVDLSQKYLTDKQCQILELIAQGKSDWDISTILGISESTVKSHVKQIFIRLGVYTRQQAITYALFLGEINYLDLNLIRPPSSQILTQESIVFLQP